jgi:hypothetical protein
LNRWAKGPCHCGARASVHRLRQAGGQKACFKQLKLFFDYCKSERLVAVDPIDSIKSPVAKATEVEVYTPEQFASLLRHADAYYRDLVSFLGAQRLRNV